MLKEMKETIDRLLQRLTVYLLSLITKLDQEVETLKQETELLRIREEDLKKQIAELRRHLS